jgi:hypothetical protein
MSRKGQGGIKNMRHLNINKYPLEQVDLQEIDDRPGPFCMSFCHDLEILTISLKTVGLLNPPLLLSPVNEKKIIVTGYRRVLALKVLGKTKIPCRILPQNDFTDLNCLMINLYDNLAKRTLNHVEKAMTLARLIPFVSRPDILQNYMPLLGLPSHEPVLNLFLNIENDLDDQTKKWLVNGTLSFQALKILFDMNIDPQTGKQIIDLIVEFKLNSNYQKQLIDISLDLSVDAGGKKLAFIQDSRIKEISSDPKLNTPQKARALICYLKEKRFPRLTGALKAFSRKVSALELPGGINILVPPYFEAEGFRLEVFFKDGEELVKNIKGLLGKNGLKELGNPWDDSI